MLDTRSEIGEFHKDYVETLRSAADLIAGRTFIDVKANQLKAQASEALRPLIATLEAIAGGKPIGADEQAVLDRGPEAMRNARDMLFEWFRPYFRANRNSELHVEALQAEEAAKTGRDWRVAHGQPQDAHQWFNVADDLKVAAEVFTGRVLGQPVISTVTVSF